MTIRFQVSKPVLAGNEKSYALDAIETTWISSNGPYIARFEAALASLLRVDECLVTSNGTTALHLACLAMDVRPGDEVIMPSDTREKLIVAMEMLKNKVAKLPKKKEFYDPNCTCNFSKHKRLPSPLTFI